MQESKCPAIKTDTYIDKCLTKLQKFIKETHSKDKYIFWPDLASCHYSKKTQAWLEDKKIKCVPKAANPPNIPKARPIEDFWALLCHKVYKDGWEAKTNQQLINRIRSSVKKIDISVVQNMIWGIKHKLRLVEDNGPLILYKK